MRFQRYLRDARSAEDVISPRPVHSRAGDECVVIRYKIADVRRDVSHTHLKVYVTCMCPTTQGVPNSSLSWTIN